MLHAITMVFVDSPFIAPDWLIHDNIKSGNLVKLFEHYDVSATDYASAIWLLYPSRDYVPLKPRVFMDHLIKRFSVTTFS